MGIILSTLKRYYRYKNKKEPNETFKFESWYHDKADLNITECSVYSKKNLNKSLSVRVTLKESIFQNVFEFSIFDIFTNNLNF